MFALPFKNNRIEFLKSHDLIAIEKLDRKLEIPITTIRQAMLIKRKIPEKYHKKIIKELKKYSFEKII
jgi:uncharacterized protein (DUF488 family)